MKKHVGIIVVLIISAALMLPNLGNRYIWGDEELTVLLAISTLENGLPYSYSHNYLIGERLYSNESFLWTWYSWLQIYITAFSFLLLGSSEFSARILFALLGLGTIALVYYYMHRISKDIRIALLSSILFAGSAMFYLYSRASMYYAPVMFSIAWLLIGYDGLLNGNKHGKLNFTLAAAMLFHSQIQIFFAIMLGIIFHYLAFNYSKRTSKELGFSLILIFFLTFPWFLITGQLSKSSYLTFSAKAIMFNLALSFFYIYLLLFPFVFLLFIPDIVKQRKRWQKQFLYLSGIMVLSVVGMLSVLNNDGAPSARRLVVSLIVFTFPVSAIILSNLLRKKKWIAITLIIVLIFSNFLYLIPFYPLKYFSFSRLSPASFGEDAAESSSIIKRFLRNSLEPRFYIIDYIYEITHDYDSVDESIIRLLKKKGSENDLYVTNAFDGVIHFYTGMTLPIIDPQKGKYYDDLNISMADWIIIRNYNKQAYLKSVRAQVNLSNYKRYIVRNLDEQWVDMPDIINHRFKTDNNGEVTIYHAP